MNSREARILPVFVYSHNIYYRTHKFLDFMTNTYSQKQISTNTYTYIFKVMLRRVNLLWAFQLRTVCALSARFILVRARTSLLLVIGVLRYRHHWWSKLVVAVTSGRESEKRLPSPLSWRRWLQSGILAKSWLGGKDPTSRSSSCSSVLRGLSSSGVRPCVRPCFLGSKSEEPMRRLEGVNGSHYKILNQEEHCDLIPWPNPTSRDSKSIP
jgi:hypothetical protein